MSVVIVTEMARLLELLEKCKGEPTRILHDGVKYGVYQEFGTRYMAPHPFMTPAVEAVRGPMKEGMGQIANLEAMDTFIDKIAHDAEGIAKAYAPVRTGALKNSIKVSKPEAFNLG
jgi:hypothetical protein